MRILLIGATGQIGLELVRSLMSLGNIIAPGRQELDLAQPSTIAPAIDAARPDVILNAAGYTAVDRAERDAAAAARVNTDAPHEIATAARKRGALYIQYSSDYVFDGRKEGEYHEDDATAPLNVYGRTLRDGELAVRASGAQHVIFRTSWVYSARRRNFLRAIVEQAKEQPVLSVVADQFGAPTYARVIAETTALALQQDLASRCKGTFESATVHLTAAGSTTWHGFATAIVTAAAASGMRLKCREVAAVKTGLYPRAAARPANSRLSCAKLAARYALEVPHWETGLAHCLSELHASAPRSI